MHTVSPKRSLTILNVGHGNAAILTDEGGTVVIDAGRSGTEVVRFLRTRGIHEIESLYLSHSDADHLGGANTILLDPELRVRQVYMNSDATKRTETHRQFRFAIVEARTERGTNTHIGLTTALNSLPRRAGTHIDVVYPSPEVAVSGVGGTELNGRPITPNSMCAVIRIGDNPSSSVLLCGDIEYSCLSYWLENNEDVQTSTVVFPHHGGNPGLSADDEIQQFTELLYSLVRPEHVVFSIHKTKYQLPKQLILDTLVAQHADINFTCTQLPVRLRTTSLDARNWRLHFGPDGELLTEVDVVCDLDSNPCVLYLVVHSN